MPVFVFSSKFIYYIVILQISSNLFLNGQNVSDSTSVNTDYCLIITINVKMDDSKNLGWAFPPPSPPPHRSPPAHTHIYIIYNINSTNILCITGTIFLLTNKYCFALCTRI